MSDIVHWLRKLAALVEADHAPQHVVMHLRAGADEIERLRAEGERLRALIEEAYCEGFQEGKDGGWIGGPSASWKSSYARAALDGQPAQPQEEA